MPRLTLAGTPGSLRTVDVTSAPSDVRYSHLRYCLVIGTAPAGLDMRAVDIVDSVIAADLRQANINFLQTPRTSWDAAAGARIRLAQLDTCNPWMMLGLMIAQVRQAAQQAGIPTAKIEAVLAEQAATPPSTWPEAFAAYRQHLTQAQVEAVLNNLGSTWTRLAQRLQGERDYPSPANAPLGLQVAGVVEGGHFIPLSKFPAQVQAVLMTGDRYGLARACEAWFAQVQPRGLTDFFCHYMRIWPGCWGEIRPADQAPQELRERWS